MWDGEGRGYGCKAGRGVASSYRGGRHSGLSEACLRGIQAWVGGGPLGKVG